MKMNSIRNILACLAVAVVASGCATGRIADLRDCGKLSVGVGLGLGADVGLGAISHPSVGILSKTHRLGTENRRISGVWSDGEVYFPSVVLAATLSESGNP